MLGDGLIAAYAAGPRVEAVQLSLDGGKRVLVSDLGASPVSTLSLAAEGQAWALVYLTAVGQPLRCFSSFDVGGTSVGAASSTLGGAVAVSSAGGVAVFRGSFTDVGWNVTDAGCPTSLRSFTPVAVPYSVDALHLPGTGLEGFRLTMSGYFNGTNGRTGVAIPQLDGGISERAVLHNEGAPYTHAAFLNALRTHALLTYLITPDLLRFHLAVRSLPVDLTLPVQQTRAVLDEPYSWAVTGCGAGCMAIAFTPMFDPPHAGVLFTSDDPIVVSRSASDAGWDIACDTPLNASTVASEFLDGKLRFLVAQPGAVRLYTCDVPP